MKTFEKARQVLRKHLAENKEKVANDLMNLRNNSAGDLDVFNYLDRIAHAFSFDRSR